MKDLTPHGIAELFAAEIAARKGRIVDSFHDERRLFARSLLHEKVEVRKRDDLEGGVAICLLEGVVSVRPYVFRLVCANGAVMAMSDEACEIDLGTGNAERHEADIREAIAACASHRAFLSAADGIRKTVGMRHNPGLQVIQLLQRHWLFDDPKVLLDVVQRFMSEQGDDGFAVMNALTSRGRDEQDPEQRWRWEEAGGSVPAVLCQPDVPLDPGYIEELPLFEEDGVLQLA